MKHQILSVLLALLSLTAPSWATVIYVSGDQTGTWSVDTVNVTAEVRVPPGESLTILPGVEVLFSVYCKLIVDNGATLRAVGTPADSIRFDVLPPDTAWHGIRFLSASDSSRLEYCNLTHGLATGSGEDLNGGAIYCSISSPTITGNTIRGNFANDPSSPEIVGSGGGIYCGNNSNPIINGNIIGGNFAMAYGGGVCCENNSSPSISGNNISGNLTMIGGISGGGGIYCEASNPSISGNTIRGNWGGGICCENHSSPTISGNNISRNINTCGGGISCSSSSPIIRDNIISENYASGSFGFGGGGGISCYSYSNPIISGNTINGNEVSDAGFGGGGIYCGGSSPIISDNTICGNSVDYGVGGGICCDGCSPTVIDNTISRNSAGAWGSVDGLGGGIYSGNNSQPTISGNVISRNDAAGSDGKGGGIYCATSNPIISGNTISGNLASWGGGIDCYQSTSTILVNCILWANLIPQIYGTPTITYSDIQGGYPGTGSIDAYPAFVDTAQDDYRLQWGSPCIDTGDPNPIYNDPDGSRADMGAWYYDQSLPVRILLTPYNAPIQIPAGGGSFQYAIQATNIATSTLTTLLWCNITLPSGAITAPVLGPVRISLGSGQTVSRVRTQNISAHAPAGMYHYNGYAVAVGDTSVDNFTFVKLGAGGLDLEAGDWTNTGEPLEIAHSGEEGIYPLSFSLYPSFPNPFNPTTVLSYQLQVASHVSLRIFDTAGRLAATLVDGWRDAGEHQITFDGSRLPSGIYFAKFTAGATSQVQKLVLLK